jgi:hypothetical protein
MNQPIDIEMNLTNEVTNEICDAVFMALGKANFAYHPESPWAVDPIVMVRESISDILNLYYLKKKYP